MPDIYEIQTEDGTFEIESDHQPTPSEIRKARQAFAAQAQQPAAPEPERGVVGTALEVGKGAAKGVGNTLYGFGKLAHDYTPLGRLSDAVAPGAFEGAPPAILEPTNTPQKVGYYGEQVGEFFLPTGVAGKLGKAAEVAKSGLLTMAQGGTPAAAGASAAITAAVPGGAALKKAGGAVKVGAEKEMAQALGATKEWAKSDAAKLAPQMLQRGVRGSREAMYAQARDAAQLVGRELDDAYKSAAQAGEAVKGDIVRGNLQLTRDALTVRDAAGKASAIPGTEGVLSKLDELDTFVESLGPDIPVDKAAHVKRTWDQIVSKAGLFGPKATASATDNANAWAIREASSSFRQLLNSNPTIADLNKEAAFWTGLKGVLKETQKRTQAQAGTGLVAAGTGGAGAVIGATTGDGGIDNAIIGGLAGRQLVKVLQSPAFRTSVAGPLKDKLADALASGSAERISAAIGRITASMPGQMQPEFAR
jgi:hypothetical protein